MSPVFYQVRQLAWCVLVLQAEGAEKSAKSAAADSRDGATGSMATAGPNPTMVRFQYAEVAVT